MASVLKKDEKYFNSEFGHTTLTEYYKTKDNSLRIGIFEDKTFVAIETSKADGVFQQTVLDQDSSYVLLDKKVVNKADGSVDHIKYIGRKN